MVKVIFEYDIPVERQAEYLRVTREKIKPFWESIGCQSYNVWQVTESEARFVKEMLFEADSVMKETLASKDSEPVKEIFRSFANDVSRRICVQKL
jgi:hypothetical protein